MTESLYLVAVLCGSVATAEWLAQRRGGRSLGGAIIVIILGAALANLGVIPSASDAPPLYGHVLAIAAPVSIFLLLLDVHLAALRRAGALMLAAFALGTLGTMLGVGAAYWLTGARDWLGEFAAPIGGMYVATYVGGSANFNALALHYRVVDDGVLFAGANAVDNVITTAWIAALLVLPRLMHRLMGTQPGDAVLGSAHVPSTERPPTLGSLATLLALAIAGHWGSLVLADRLSSIAFAVPSILILTTLALAAAQLGVIRRLGGANLLGTYGAYLFLAVVGAYCDVASLVELGRLGLMLLLFVTLAVSIHGLVVFGAGALLRLQPEVMAVASCANIGGATTVMPIARGLARLDLLLPGILVGALGAALGTYLGFLTAWLLGA